MTNESKEKLNSFLVKTFNSILNIEERALKNGEFSDLSISKMHLIEEICKEYPSNMSSIAENLDITVGTLTVAVDKLVKQGYINRIKSPVDKRVVTIVPTEKGLNADKKHKQFHEEMVNTISSVLTEDELFIFAKAIDTVAHHFSEVKQNNEV